MFRILSIHLQLKGVYKWVTLDELTNESKLLISVLVCQILTITWSITDKQCHCVLPSLSEYFLALK